MLPLILILYQIFFRIHINLQDQIVHVHAGRDDQAVQYQRLLRQILLPLQVASIYRRIQHHFVLEKSLDIEQPDVIFEIEAGSTMLFEIH